ncbi:hypothetical protein NW752_012006 [Fusarium irregulare]|nr:hypothetical protein NW752_012006 [Fusarium irregulare]
MDRMGLTHVPLPPLQEQALHYWQVIDAPATLFQWFDLLLLKWSSRWLSTSFVRDDQKEPAPGEPNQIYLPIFKDKAITLPESNILIADFGEAFCPAEEDRFESNTSFAYRPPEAYFEPKTPLSYPSDIWSLGCTIWEMSGSDRFLDGHYDEDYNARVQIDRLGPLPPEWSDGWERPPDFYDDGDGILFEAPEEQTWDQRFQETIQDPRRMMDVGAFDDDESQAFQEMLKAMIVFRPSERLAAEQVLNTRWMREYALPEWEKIER